MTARTWKEASREALQEQNRFVSRRWRHYTHNIVHTYIYVYE